jgi:hypothetical protein
MSGYSGDSGYRTTPQSMPTAIIEPTPHSIVPARSAKISDLIEQYVQCQELENSWTGKTKGVTCKIFSAESKMRGRS